MLYCIYINIKRSYPTLHVRVINCEIRVVIYTFFKLLGSEKFRMESMPHLIFIKIKVNSDLTDQIVDICRAEFF